MSEQDETNTMSGQWPSGGPIAGQSPYDILGVDRDADAAGLRSALRSLLRRAGTDQEREMAEAAFDALTRPRVRLTLDLFAPRESRLYDEIVRRYASVRFELVPDDVAPLLMQASDMECGEPFTDFEVPDVPRVVFENMLPAPPRGDELVVPDRRK
ncbi:MAG: hypothetical protein WC538_04400 [Thermoanaerobaculia bacterium]